MNVRVAQDAKLGRISSDDKPHSSSVVTLPPPRPATSDVHFLAEGPVWDPIRGRMLWVDILAGVVRVARFSHGGSLRVDTTLLFSDTAGAIAISATGEMIIAGTSCFHFRDPDGTISIGRDLNLGPGRRLNDGKPDPAGRFVVGTKGPGSGERLLRLEADGTVTSLDDDLTLSNGLAWTRDGRQMYNVDTATRQIFVRDYDASSGAVGERRTFIHVEDGFPDGITVDAEDHLWVAIWGGGCVNRYDPNGQLVARLPVPAPHVTSVCFGGPDLRTLVITTAREDLSPEQLEASPLSGLLFTATPAVPGVEPTLWSGLTRPPTLGKATT